MKKFHDWYDQKLNEVEHPQTAAANYAKFLAQIMGWKHGQRPQNFISRGLGKMSRWVTGNEKSGIGGDIYSIISDPKEIDEIINLAKKDGVFANSTYRASYGMLRQIHDKYQTKGTEFDSPKFAAYLLHNILGKCHKNMQLDYTDAEELYHDIMGTNPAAKKALQRAYNKDPQNLTQWKTIASNKANKPHPTFNFDDEHTVYYFIETSGVISPYHLIKMLISKAPDKTLSYPNNAQDILDYSTEFAEAYFPERINLARRNQGEEPTQPQGNQPQPQGNKGQQQSSGRSIADFARMLNAFSHGFDDVANTDANGNPTPDNSVQSGQKATIMQAIKNLFGTVPTPASGSVMAKLQDHNTSFYGMQKLLEEKKLN